MCAQQTCRALTTSQARFSTRSRVLSGWHAPIPHAVAGLYSRSHQQLHVVLPGLRSCVAVLGKRLWTSGTWSDGLQRTVLPLPQSSLPCRTSCFFFSKKCVFSACLNCIIPSPMGSVMNVTCWFQQQRIHLVTFPISTDLFMSQSCKLDHQTVLGKERWDPGRRLVNRDRRREHCALGPYSAQQWDHCWTPEYVPETTTGTWLGAAMITALSWLSTCGRNQCWMSIGSAGCWEVQVKGVMNTFPWEKKPSWSIRRASTTERKVWASTAWSALLYGFHFVSGSAHYGTTWL